ncbi:MAG: O-linked N-acetylglucosamine transferase, SPINDLY family protein [Pseudanabaenaceae cyanobacterium]|jgi:predicted O-linked N-acetylglucosamine transferase (SPINDLY family)
MTDLNLLNGLLEQERYSELVIACHSHLETNPEDVAAYWYWGLGQLLQGAETEAQITWLEGFTIADSREDYAVVQELVDLLDHVAEQKRQKNDHAIAWTLRQHLREINPENLGNLLHLMGLSLILGNFDDESLNSLGILEVIAEREFSEITKLELELLLSIFNELGETQQFGESFVALSETCLALFKETDSEEIFGDILIRHAMSYGHSAGRYAIGIQVLSVLQQLQPTEVKYLWHAAQMHYFLHQYNEGLALIEKAFALSDSPVSQVCSSHLKLRGLLSAGGRWSESLVALEAHRQNVETLYHSGITDLDSVSTGRTYTTTYYPPYMGDCAAANRLLNNQIGAFCQRNVETYAAETYNRYRQSHIIKQEALRANRETELNRKLKIGYIGHTFCRHSVGWLMRSLILHHDRDQVEVYGYFMNYRSHPDHLQDWYLRQFDQVRTFMLKDMLKERFAPTEQIFADGIDILIDVDSLTLDLTCEVMALKPAPIQATWLGWDASGIPTIDYYIADNYAIPEHGQEYYQEKIWRLPHSFIGVDGFEVSIPELRREDLHLPPDAVVYYSGQRGFKRHPETVRAQMEILRQVPNSYFLIKGSADEVSVKSFFEEMATAAGVSPERLRFVRQSVEEATHRAEIALADVVLDTYPYNGATTTLETLWVGVPLVTWVGEQYSARNSYSMMFNAGIMEGIAWNYDEYVNWGVRFGLEPELRDLVSTKLRKSRHTAPIWHGKLFATEMEAAYRQMWANFING